MGIRITAQDAAQLGLPLPTGKARRARGSKHAPREADILRHCLELLGLRGVLAWRSNNVGIWDASRGCYRSFRGRKGISDILAVIPPRGTLAAIEVKGPKGRITKEQKDFLTTVQRRGGLAIVVRSVGELEDVLRRWLG